MIAGLKTKQRRQLLAQLAESMGYADSMELLEEVHLDSVVPGICTACSAETDVEPDQEEGWCDACREGRVVSCMVLADLI